MVLLRATLRPTKGGDHMRIGGSLALIAIGAILKWAITAHINGVDLQAIGIILMVVGAIGLVLTVAFMASRRRTDVIHRDGATTYMEPRDNTDYYR
jgi:apolipoprotein N-acyltransferase